MSCKKNKRRRQKLSIGNIRLPKRDISLYRSRSNIGNELRRAFQYYQSGQLQKAEGICKRILEIDPGHSDCLHLLGVIVNHVGKRNVAANLVNKAIQNNPENPIYYNTLGVLFQGQGRSEEAISCYRKVLKLKPDHPDPYYNMGNAFKGQGKSEKAIACYQKALQLKPDYADAYNNMGNVFQDQGKSEEAVACYQKALQLKPDYADAYNNMGNVFEGQGRWDEAISCYRKVLKLKPDHPDPYYNMGNAFKGQSKPEEAIACYQKALQLKPDFADAYNNMGNVFQAQGKSEEAVACYQKALQLKPDLVGTYNNMGNVFQDQGKLKGAISCYQKAVRLKPDYADAYNNMGIAFQDQGRSEEAIACYQKALELKPDLADACNHLVHQLQHTCAWQNLGSLTAKLDGLTGGALNNGTRTAEAPFVSLARHNDLSHNFAVAKSWSCDIARSMSDLKMRFSFDGKRSGKTRIVVGYLSNNFQNHTMAHLMLGLFGLHNRDEFQISCYSYGDDDGGLYRKGIQRDCDKFVDIRNLSHAEAAKCIYEDQVDILVDLMGHTRGSRLYISALRPAPIQARYLGLAGTTGADFFDYIITDRIITPEDHAQHYSETFVYLPHSYQVNDRTQAISNRAWKRAEFGLPEDSFVFCSFNQAYKIEPVMFDSWMKILRQVPEGVLWLQRANETVEKNLRLETEARGVKPERLIFSQKLPPDEHLARLRLADLSLDTRIVNGAATTSDALWVGVPVITLQGGHFASRMSSSILTAIGLSELVTHTLEDYEAVAVRLARNPGELQAIRQRLEKNRLTEPLFDTPRFAGNLEKAYKEMWEIFLGGERPRQIEVAESQS